MDFYGLPVGILENEYLHLEYLRDAGPRIVRLTAAGSDFNLFAEMPDFTVPTLFGDYHFTGGHRLWHAPEELPRTYIPDNEGLEIQPLEGGVRLIQPVEPGTSIRKSMEIRLQPGRAGLEIQHRLENAGLWAVDLAPWAITQMVHGGVAILPQQLPEDPRNLLQADRVLAVWSYTVLSDPRLHLGDDFILMDGTAAQPPCKIGALNRRGWIAYLNHGVLFVKHFAPQLDRPHVDFGCNSEIYVDHRFLEIETLGPLAHLEPGQSVLHTETWSLYPGLDYSQDAGGVRTMVKDLGIQ